MNQRNLLSKVLAQNAQHAKLFCIGRWKTKAQAKCVRKSILRKRLHHHYVKTDFVCLDDLGGSHSDMSANLKTKDTLLSPKKVVKFEES